MQVIRRVHDGPSRKRPRSGTPSCLVAWRTLPVQAARQFRGPPPTETSS
jgi:hypothetical protein